MEKIIVISSNNNPDYLFYAPYMVKAWHKLGWKVCIIVTHDVEDVDLYELSKPDFIIKMPEFAELRTETIAQASRLYAANFLPLESLIMTSDMDLLPLQNYWNPDPTKITNYGHDLTDYSFYPMGYTAMTGLNWLKVMQLTGNTQQDLIRDAKEIGLPYAPDWESWWNHDWTLLTKRLKPFEGELVKVLRGRRVGSPFAYGRVDRGDSMQIPDGELIDAHLENHNVKHPDKLNKFLSLYNKYYE